MDEVVAGPGGAMTRNGGTLTGPLTVSTTISRGGRARVTIRQAGAEEWHALAGSPFPVPPEGIETLHALVVSSIGAASCHPAPGHYAGRPIEWRSDDGLVPDEEAPS